MTKQKSGIMFCCLAVVFILGKMNVQAYHVEVPLAGLTWLNQDQNKKVSPNLAVVRADGYVNIREKAGTDSAVVGRLYNNSGVYMVKKEGQWCQVRSGGLSGYVNTDFLVTGTAAQTIAEEVGLEVATVNTTTLNVREEADKNANVLTIVGNAEKLHVMEEKKDWVRVAVNDAEGYITKDHVAIALQLPEAEMLEVVNARLSAAKEAASRAQDMRNEAVLAMNQIRAEDAAYAAEAAREASTEAKVLAAEQPLDYELQEIAEWAIAAADEADYAAAMAKEAAERPTPETEETKTPETEIETKETPPETESETEPVTEPVTETQPQTESGQTEETAVPTLSRGTADVRQQIVNYAIQFVGNPYIYGGTDLNNGADCSGFTQSIMKNFGYTLPRTAGEQSVSGKEVQFDELKPGDLLFYSGDADYGIDHVTMYIGGGQVVHASSPSNGIIISNITYRPAYTARSYID